MRARNGQFVNRLPAETEGAPSAAATVGKNIGAAALNAVVLVTCIKLVDLAFHAITSKQRARQVRVHANGEAVAA